MLTFDQDRPHFVTVAAVRNMIKAENAFPLVVNVTDLAEIDAANEKYIRAKTHWSTRNTDATMIELIGAWARLNRILWLMDDKYGVAISVKQ